MKPSDVAIIGGGVMGLAAACELARQGAKVTIIDQAVIPNPQAASFDHSKVFRFAYPERFYVRLAIDALERWKEIERETNERLLTRTGALLIAMQRNSFETDCFDAMKAEGVAAELLERDELSDRFPQFDVEAFEFGVFDPEGAITHAEKALRALIELAGRRGVRMLEGHRVISLDTGSGQSVSLAFETRESLSCARILIASGPWSRMLFPELAKVLETTRQDVIYFEPEPETRDQYDPTRFPIFLELQSGFYGFPIHNAAMMKIANHHKGKHANPGSVAQESEAAVIESCRKFFHEFIPGLENSIVGETRVCIYNNTPDDDFIIDWYSEIGSVLIATGFSGHGFKFAPTIGRIAADLLLSGTTPFDIDRFAISRFKDEVRRL